MSSIYGLSRSARRQPTRGYRSSSSSSTLADDVGDVLVALFLLLDEGGIVDGLVLISMSSSPSRSPRARRSSCLAPRHPPPRAKRIRPPASPASPPLPARPARRAGRRRLRPRARGNRRELHHRVAFRADDRVLAEVVEFRAAIRAKALGAELGFCHGPGSLRAGLKLRCFTWPVALPLSIAR